MKREIKFRAFCSNEMKYEIETSGQFGFYLTNFPVMQYTELKDKYGKDIYEGDIVKCIEFKNNAISLFTETELETFNLEEIKGEKKLEYISPIIFEEGCFFVKESEQCDCYLSLFYGDNRKSQPIFEIEVIGNIYENPELLK